MTPDKRKTKRKLCWASIDYPVDDIILRYEGEIRIKFTSWYNERKFYHRSGGYMLAFCRSGYFDDTGYNR